MNENKYVIFSDDTVETKQQPYISKDDEKRIDDIIENALTTK